MCQPILRSAHPSSRAITGTTRSMSRKDSIPHELRTAAEPRQNRLFPVRLSQVAQVNPSIRLLRLALPDSDSVRPFPSFILVINRPRYMLKPLAYYNLARMIRNNNSPFSRANG